MLPAERPAGHARNGTPEVRELAAEPVAPGSRGATVITDRVVAKIAARAAREALGGVPEGGAPPHATVTLHQDHARVRVGVDLGHPCDIGERCAAVRRRVVQRVKSLADMEAREVVVQVERLHSARARVAARGRLR
ncbi:hypothetical protein GCM10009654_50510 [Streptomyces hebeiensis]|uniref:Asp23/Gls24 family envelope stress response protein n=1 Tax=Streptomyces hebeiensis TaxID=229486 RepID=A0ABN1V3F3_9ACTN